MSFDVEVVLIYVVTSISLFSIGYYAGKRDAKKETGGK